MVLTSGSGSYVWDATLTAGKYGFPVYGPDGFLTSFPRGVKSGGAKTVSWPTDHYGHYDVVITANSTDGFRRRYAGRIA